MELEWVRLARGANGGCIVGYRLHILEVIAFYHIINLLILLIDVDVGNF